MYVCMYVYFHHILFGSFAFVCQGSGLSQSREAREAGRNGQAGQVGQAGEASSSRRGPGRRQRRHAKEELAGQVRGVDPRCIRIYLSLYPRELRFKVSICVYTQTVSACFDGTVGRDSVKSSSLMAWGNGEHILYFLLSLK